MKKSFIQCDSCKREINSPWYIENDFMMIDNSMIWILPNEGIALHFCGMKCLENWIKKETVDHSDCVGR